MVLKKRMIDLTGQTFSRLTVISYSGEKRGKDHYWNCVCNCGNEIKASTRSLRHNTTKSCGCLQREHAKTLRPIVHGYAKVGGYHPLYATWVTMKQRCENPNNMKYPRYGGRGIKVCDRWQSFSHFLGDMGDKPPNTSLDRIDNDGDYTPENCRWATPYQQSHNKDFGRFIEYNGETLRLFDLAARHKMNPTTLWYRIKRGWSIENALNRPKDEHDFSIEILEFNGEHKPVSEWAKESGVNERTIYDRLHRGWTVERALTQAVRFRRH